MIVGLEDFKISHVFWEGNKLMDHLANLQWITWRVNGGEEGKLSWKTLCDLVRNDVEIFGLSNEINDEIL